MNDFFEPFELNPNMYELYVEIMAGRKFFPKALERTK
jgi:hypothetical protein